MKKTGTSERCGKRRRLLPSIRIGVHYFYKEVADSKENGATSFRRKASAAHTPRHKKNGVNLRPNRRVLIRDKTTITLSGRVIQPTTTLQNSLLS